MAKANEKVRRVLVTGGAGFIGSRLSEFLASKGWQVTAIDNLNNYYDPKLKLERLHRMGINRVNDYGSSVSSIFPNLEFIRLDIVDREALNNLFADKHFDSVMNLAAQAGVRYSIENPYTYVENNLVGFINLLECARHFPLRRFVYASSSSVYGGNEKTPFSESDNVDNPVSLYAATKKSNELMARAYHNLYGIPAIGLRFFTVYGPWGRPDMAPMLFADAITHRRPIKVFNNGNMSRDFTYIDDIVEGIYRVLDSDVAIDKEHDVYNIGFGKPVKLMDFISVLEKSLGVSAEKDFLPMQPGDVVTTFADTSRLARDYVYSPRIDIEEGVKRFAEWFRNFKPSVNKKC